MEYNGTWTNKTIDMLKIARRFSLSLCRSQQQVHKPALYEGQGKAWSAAMV